MKVKLKKPAERIFSNTIKELLIEKEMSPQELADLTGLTPSHISRIINGKRPCLSLPIALRIANVLKESVETVFIYKKPVVISKEKLDEE